MRKIKPCICGHHRTCHAYEARKLSACREEGCACGVFYPQPRIYMRKIRLTKGGYGREGTYASLYFGMTSYHWRREGEEYEWNIGGSPRSSRWLPAGVSKREVMREAWARCQWEDAHAEKGEK